MKPKNGSNLNKNQITKEYNPFLDKEGITTNNDYHSLINNDENKRSKNLLYKCINYIFSIYKFIFQTFMKQMKRILILKII